MYARHCYLSFPLLRPNIRDKAVAKLTLSLIYSLTPFNPLKKYSVFIVYSPSSAAAREVLYEFLMLSIIFFIVFSVVVEEVSLSYFQLAFSHCFCYGLLGGLYYHGSAGLGGFSQPISISYYLLGPLRLVHLTGPVIRLSCSLNFLYL